ncbi:L-aspartate oxidase [compost metagenome]
MSSGSFAGEGAAAYAAGLGRHAADRTPAGLSSSPLVHRQVQPGAAAREAEYAAAVQAEVKPYDINLFRTEQGLSSSLERLDGLWKEQRSREIQRTPEGVRAREAEAMTATARWMYSSALARTETRGMHKREDYKATDNGQHHRLISGGLDQVWVRTEEVAKESVLL